VTRLRRGLAVHPRGYTAGMTDDPIISDDDITRDRPTEGQDDKDQGAVHDRDSGDEPTEDDENLDTGGEGARDVGDE
jgi:hypothetical protein